MNFKSVCALSAPVLPPVLRPVVTAVTLLLTLTLTVACSNSSSGGGGGIFGGGAGGGGGTAGGLHAAKPGQITPTSIFGIWKVATGGGDDGAVRVSTLAKIEKNRFIVETRCEVAQTGQAVFAQVSSGATVSEDRVRILENKKDVKNLKVGDQTLQCEASIEPVELAYVIQNGQVFAGMPGTHMELVLESKISD